MNLKIIIILYSLFVFPVVAQENSDRTNFFQGKTKLSNPFSLRDPFKEPSRRSERQMKKEDGSMSALMRNGVFTNRALVELTSIDQIKIIGVLVGKQRRALAKVTNKEGKAEGETVTLKEGMKIGPNDAELKAILPGGIVIVEKIQNVYGQDEYLETVIPISSN